MQSGKDKVRNSTREESNVRYGMNILHTIVKIGEKRNAIYIMWGGGPFDCLLLSMRFMRRAVHDFVC